MAVKKFHITPDGPRRCTAKFKLCPEVEHYGSPESAIAADEVKKRNDVHRAELRRLHDILIDPSSPYLSRSAFSFVGGGFGHQKFGEDTDGQAELRGIRPEDFRSGGTFRMKNGNGLDVNVQVRRTSAVDESLARFVGVWRFLVVVNKSGLVRHTTTEQDVTFDFSTAEDVNESLAEVNKFFRAAVVRSGIREDNEADKRAAEMSEHFKNMFNAVESDAAGDFDLWDRGMGYFTESDSDTIIVDVDYRTSAFRAENFKRFLSENPYYRGNQPDVQIRVTDGQSFTPGAWTVKRESGQWGVEKTSADGTSAETLILDAQEILDHVYYHTKTEVNPGNEEEALRKGRYAVALMVGVETALEGNKAVVERWWQENVELREAAQRASPKRGATGSSLMGRIFGSSS